MQAAPRLAPGTSWTVSNAHIIQKCPCSLRPVARRCRVTRSTARINAISSIFLPQSTRCCHEAVPVACECVHLFFFGFGFHSRFPDPVRCGRFRFFFLFRFLRFLLFSCDSPPSPTRVSFTLYIFFFIARGVGSSLVGQASSLKP